MARKRVAYPDQPEPVARFATAFEDLRMSTGMSLVRLSARVGKSDTTLSRYQTGQGLPDEKILASIYKLAENPPLTLDQMKDLLGQARAAKRGDPEMQLADGNIPGKLAHSLPVADPQPQKCWKSRLFNRSAVAKAAAAVIVAVCIALGSWVASPGLGVRSDRDKGSPSRL